jgi:hypothetical protein
MMRDGTDYASSAVPVVGRSTPYFPHMLAFVDGGMFNNQPLGEAINFAAEQDPNGTPDPNRLFLLIHPNISITDHQDTTDDGSAKGSGFITKDFSLAQQAKRLLGMLMIENAVDDWMRANEVNGLLEWRKEFIQSLLAIVQSTTVSRT